MKKGKLLNDVLQGLLTAAAVAAAMPHLAFAATDLNSGVAQTTMEISYIPNIIDACFYIGGAAFVGSGLLKLKAYSENPGQTPLGQGVGRLSVGAALLALPFIASSLTSTFGLGTSGTTFTTFQGPTT
jgi:hypothetical protein